MYITITGQKHYFGMLPFSVGETVILRPEPENVYDNRAIAVYTKVHGKSGMVAQSADMRADGTVSASAIYDKIGVECTATVRFIAGDFILAKVHI